MTKFEIARSDGVIVLFSSIGMQRGGITRAVLDRVKLYAANGIPVRIVLTGFSFSEDQEVAQLREHWDLPESVQFHFFWREAAPGGGGALVEHTRTSDDDGVTSFRDEKDGSVSSYRDGILTQTKAFDEDRLKMVTWFDPARRPVSRDLYDAAGQLVCSDQLDPSTGHQALRRWFDSSGACWLTTWITSSGQFTETVQHLPTPMRYEHLQHRVAEWLDSVVADWEHPVAMVDYRRHDRIMLGLRHPGLKTVAVMHNCHTEEPYRSIDPTKLSFKRLLTNLDRIDAAVALTHRQRDDILERSGASNIHVINNPIPRVQPVDAPRQPGLLVAISRLVPQKQIDHAVRAFAVAAGQVPGAQFHIYGKGPERRRLRALISELGMTDQIRLAGFTSDPLETFAGATASVLSSQYEGLPLVLAEAMSVGTPFVAYDLNYGPDEVIRHEEDGLLVPPGDIQALADGMVRLLADPVYAAKLGARAREVVDRFSRQRWADEWLALHGRLVGADTRVGA